MVYYDIDGNPIDAEEWARLFNEDRVIGSDYLGDVHVSTVWLGLDHSFGGKKPLIFETMVFGLEEDELQWRYSTKKEAIKGHKEAVESVRRTLDKMLKI